jgi:hypothetical protein
VEKANAAKDRKCPVTVNKVSGPKDNAPKGVETHRNGEGLDNNGIGCT